MFVVPRMVMGHKLDTDVILNGIILTSTFYLLLQNFRKFQSFPLFIEYQFALHVQYQKV